MIAAIAGSLDLSLGELTRSVADRLAGMQVARAQTTGRVVLALAA